MRILLYIYQVEFILDKFDSKFILFNFGLTKDHAVTKLALQ